MLFVLCFAIVVATTAAATDPGKLDAPAEQWTSVPDIFAWFAENERNIAPPPEAFSKDGFHLFSLASNHQDYGVFRFRHSAKAHGYGEPIILKSPPRWKLMYKIPIIQSFLNILPEEDVVMFTDSYDVIFLRPRDEILAEFRSLNHPVVFSAEVNCFPIEEICGDVPQHPSPYKHINSGAFIGVVRELKKAYSLFAKLAMDTSSLTETDQKVFQLVYTNNKGVILLDWEQRLFQTLYLAEDHVEILEDGRTRNKYTGKFPFLVHGNAGASLNPWASTMNYGVFIVDPKNGTVVKPNDTLALAISVFPPDFPRRYNPATVTVETMLSFQILATIPSLGSLNSPLDSNTSIIIYTGVQIPVDISKGDHVISTFLYGDDEEEFSTDHLAIKVE